MRSEFRLLKHKLQGLEQSLVGEQSKRQREEQTTLAALRQRRDEVTALSESLEVCPFNIYLLYCAACSIVYRCYYCSWVLFNYVRTLCVWIVRMFNMCD